MPGGGYPPPGPMGPMGAGYPPPAGPPGGGGYGPPGGPMGGPPGFHAPGQPQKKGPPVALLVGGGCGLFAVLGVIVLVIALVAGRSSASEGDASPSSDGPSKPTQDESVGDVMAGAVYKRIPSTNVEVPVPPGWREDARSLYTFAISGDNNALLAFTTVSSVGEFTGRIQHAVQVFRITNCAMQDAQRVRMGPNQLRARLTEGNCNFNGVPAHVAIVLIESGRRAHPFVIYAVDNNAPKQTVEQAQQTIARMRER